MADNLLADNAQGDIISPGSQASFIPTPDLNPLSGHTGDPSNPPRCQNSGNHSPSNASSSCTSECSSSNCISDLSLGTHPPIDTQIPDTREKVPIPLHDTDDLYQLEDEPVKPESKGALEILLAKHSHLNLSGKIQDISTVQRSIGGYSDIYIGTYVPGNDARFKVAIKKLRMNITDDKDFQKILARELYIWSKLDHPRVLRLEGFFIEDNRYPSFVSKWMDGGTAIDYVRRDPNMDVLQLIISIGEGLDYLHSHNIVHSDIKPDNVLMSSSGEPLLCDFGVSRMLEASDTFHFSSTLTGGLRGTIRYLSKELVLGSGKGVVTFSKESDVWAFGMTGIAILQRKPPYPYLRNDVQVIVAIGDGQVPRWPSDFPGWKLRDQIIWRICFKCWDSPSERPAIPCVLYELRRLKCLDERVSLDRFEWLKYHFSRLKDNDLEPESDDGQSTLEEDPQSDTPRIVRWDLLTEFAMSVDPYVPYYEM